MKNNLTTIIEKQDIEALVKYISNPTFKTGDHKNVMKAIKKSNWDVGNFDVTNPILKWYKFIIELSRLKKCSDQLKYIDNNLDYFDSWWSVDGMIQYLVQKNMDFEDVYKYSKKYVNDKREFVARLGYIYFFCSLINDETIDRIALLFHDDERYYVQMAEAWLLCEMVTKNQDKGFLIIANSNLKYNILGKAIQKCSDSFRISEETKKRLKDLRAIKKLN